MSDMVSIGDPVEVKQIVWDEGEVEVAPGKTLPYEQFTEEWVPATVLFVSQVSIGVAFAGGVRKEIELKSGRLDPDKVRDARRR